MHAPSAPIPGIDLRLCPNYHLAQTRQQLLEMMMQCLEHGRTKKGPLINTSLCCLSENTRVLTTVSLKPIAYPGSPFRDYLKVQGRILGGLILIKLTTFLGEGGNYLIKDAVLVLKTSQTLKSLMEKSVASDNCQGNRWQFWKLQGKEHSPYARPRSPGSHLTGDSVQDMLLQNITHWNIDYFKLKESEKWHLQKWLSDLPLKQVIKPLCEKYPPYI